MFPRRDGNVAGVEVVEVQCETPWFFFWQLYGAVKCLPLEVA